MAQPIEMIRGTERTTVYDNSRANALVADGWQRVSDLPRDKQRELRDRPPSPWDGYESLTAQEVIAQAKGLPPERIQEVVVYESSTKGRVSIVNALFGRPSTPGETNATEAPPVTVETVTEKPLQTTETVKVVAEKHIP